MSWESKQPYDEVAPDGSEVCVGLQTGRGSMALFSMAPARVSQAVKHRTIEEIWYFMGGRGEFWRRDGERDQTVEIQAGTWLTIPPGTEFQFRVTGPEALRFVIATMPPWPGPQEAILVEGKWSSAPRAGRS